MEMALRSSFSAGGWNVEETTEHALSVGVWVTCRIMHSMISDGRLGIFNFLGWGGGEEIDLENRQCLVKTIVQCQKRDASPSRYYSHAETAMRVSRKTELGVTMFHHSREAKVSRRTE